MVGDGNMKRAFYEVNYHFIDRNNDNHYFQIGYFSTKENAKKSIDKLREKSGFKDTNGVFEIDKFSVDFDKIKQDKKDIVLYELSHEYTDSEGYDNFIVFGVYSTYDEAEFIKNKKAQEIPYIDYPEGFLIADSKIDICGWSEGFSCE